MYEFPTLRLLRVESCAIQHGLSHLLNGLPCVRCHNLCDVLDVNLQPLRKLPLLVDTLKETNLA